MKSTPLILTLDQAERVDREHRARELKQLLPLAVRRGWVGTLPCRPSAGNNKQDPRPPMITTASQPLLFDATKPRSLEVAGGDLVGVLASLKAQGAHVGGMALVNRGRWRLTMIDWPNQNGLPCQGRPGMGQGEC